MKIAIYFFVHIFICAANAESCQDSAGIYKTMDDFNRNNLSYITPYRLKEQFGFLRSDFDFVAQGKIFLRQTSGDFISFVPNQIYGFYNNGYKYLFVPELSKYLVPVSLDPVTIFAVENTVYANYIRSTTLKLIYLDKRTGLKDLTDSNIENDFENNTELIANLKNINKQFTKLKGSNKLRIQQIDKFIQTTLKPLQ